MKILKSFFRKKTVLGVILFLSFLSLFAFPLKTPVKARFVEDVGVQGEKNTWEKFSQSVNSDQIDIWSFTGYPLQGIMAHIVALIGGYPDESGNITFNSIDKSFIGSLARLINYTYEKPVSSTQYLAYLSRKLNLASPAYAQSQGWVFLQPVIEIWKVVRDITYLFFVAVFVGIGFMIMFRSKVNPQTVASIQSAIPKIVVALILVTFSYAISGLIIDFVFLFNGLITRTFFGSPGNWTNIGLIIDQALSQISGARAKPPVPRPPIPAPLNTVNLDVIIEVFWKYMPSLNLGGLLKSINIPLALVFSIIVVSTAFRLFLSLLSKYVTLILSTFISPFVFLWGALPGQGEVGSWFRTMFSSAATFPAVFLVLNIAIYLGNISTPFQDLTPFTLDLFQKGAIVGAPTLNAAKLVSFGIFLLSPKIPEIIDSLFKAERAGLVGGVMAPEISGALKRIPVIGSFLG